MVGLSALRLCRRQPRGQFLDRFGRDHTERNGAVLDPLAIDSEADLEASQPGPRERLEGRFREDVTDRLSYDLVPVAGLRVQRSPLCLPALLTGCLELPTLF